MEDVLSVAADGVERRNEQNRRIGEVIQREGRKLLRSSAGASEIKPTLKTSCKRSSMN